MNEQDLETLSAYLDGELSAAEQTAVKERLLSDPAFRRGLDELRTGDDLLLAYASRIDRRPMPETLTPDVLRQSGDSSDQSGAGRWAALAAALVMAVGLVSLLNTGRDTLTLDTAMSGQPFVLDGEQVQVVASFRTYDQGICRELEGESLRAISCHQGGEWQTVLEVDHSPLPEGVYQPAGTDGIADIDSFVARSKFGDVLSAEEEAVLISTGWQTPE